MYVFGTFSAPKALTVGNNPRALTRGRFNNDAFDDLEVSNKDSNNVSVLLGNGSGGFSSAVNFAVGAAPVADRVDWDALVKEAGVPLRAPDERKPVGGAAE